MNKILFLAVAIFFQIHSLAAQKYFSKAGRIQFVSDAPLEKIEANNNSAMIVIDVANSQIELSVLIKGFQFAKALMQDHFNENYMESHKYPKALFKGKIINMEEINLNKDNTYPVHVTGELTLHGVTKPFITSGQFIVKSGKITASSTFDIIVADFNIEIPKVVRENVAKTVKVQVYAELQLMK